MYSRLNENKNDNKIWKNHTKKQKEVEMMSRICIILSIVITVIILMQEGKSAGLGAIAGAAETYWGKNKGRSMEGMLVKLTRVAVILFLVLAMVLNLGIW